MLNRDDHVTYLGNEPTNSEPNEYELQALQFLADTNTRMIVEYDRCAKYFDDDKEPRDVYRITLRRHTNEPGNVKEYSFEFGNSIQATHEAETPTAYDILACLERYCPDDFDDFCNEFGYDNDSRKAYAIFEKVHEQSLNLQELFTTDELEQLAGFW